MGKAIGTSTRIPRAKDDQTHLPDDLKGRRYYRPKEQ